MRFFLDRIFGLKKHQTNVRTEFLAGFTTFITMVYIIILNPLILSHAGMDKGGVFLATVVISAISSVIMGLYANWPVALAPGMGLNAFFTYVIVLTMGLSWQEALFAVFCSGILFLIVSVTPIRRKIMEAIPTNLKIGISVGVGLLLVFIGLQNAGIVVANQATISGLGDLSSPSVLMAGLGFLLIVILEGRKVKGALIITTLLITGLSFFLTDNKYQGVVGTLPKFTTLLELDFNFKLLFNASFVGVIFSLLFVDFFDSTGTLLAVSKFMPGSKGKAEKRPLVVDSFATVLGSLLGTSTATVYIESTTGVKQGGRTGLTAVVTGLLFLLCLFFFPLVRSIPTYATAPALIYVGFLFLQNLKEVDISNIFELIPVCTAAILMPLTFSISHGIIFGFLSYLAVCIGEGKITQITPTVWIISALCVLYLFL